MELFVVSLSIYHLMDAPAKPARYLAAEANLYMLTIYHQCNGSISLIWGRRTGKVPSYYPKTYCHVMQIALGEPLKGPSLSLPHEGKLILVIRNLYLSVLPINVLEDKVLLQKHFFAKTSE